jgi:hypothetical protein
MLILLLILILVFGGGFGYHRYGYSRYGNRGYGLLSIIVLILLLYWLFGAGGLGGLHNSWLSLRTNDHFGNPTSAPIDIARPDTAMAIVIRWRRIVAKAKVKYFCPL